MRPLKLIETARRLATVPGSGRPRQSDLKRAVSTAYYALFHELSRCVADGFLGSVGQTQTPRAWTQAYRSVEHGLAKAKCLNKDVLSRFPNRIQDLANAFVELQIQRELADYDPVHRVTRTEVAALIDTAHAAINGFRKADSTDRRAFAVWVALKERRRT